jgi:hypothetical protein
MPSEDIQYKYKYCIGTNTITIIGKGPILEKLFNFEPNGL